MHISDVAARLRSMDHVLILTHVRPDGDTIGCAAALCCALRHLGKEAYLLYNPGITSTYQPYASALNLIRLLSSGKLVNLLLEG